MTTGDHQSQGRDLSCAQCGATTVSTSWVDDTLVWGSGESAMTISVRIPFRSCLSCDFTYLDDEAEDIRHNAVCRHLGVLTPSEIRGIREEYQMSEAEFARATGLGEATVGLAVRASATRDCTTTTGKQNSGKERRHASFDVGRP